MRLEGTDNTLVNRGTITGSTGHGALVAGNWWWIAAPTLVAIVLFLGLYLLFASINEYIDPRTRLRLIGG